MCYQRKKRPVVVEHEYDQILIHSNTDHNGEMQVTQHYYVIIYYYV